jgi:hypothetical protein
MKDYLEEEIAHFFGEFRVVAGIQGVQDLVGFFEEIGAQRGVSLLAVPGTAVRRAEAFLDGE